MCLSNNYVLFPMLTLFRGHCPASLPQPCSPPLSLCPFHPCLPSHGILLSTFKHMQVIFPLLKVPFFDPAVFSNCLLISAFHQTPWKGNCWLYLPNTSFLISPFQSQIRSCLLCQWFSALAALGVTWDPEPTFRCFDLASLGCSPRQGETSHSSCTFSNSMLLKEKGNNCLSPEQFQKAEIKMDMLAILKILKLPGKLFYY